MPAHVLRRIGVVVSLLPCLAGTSAAQQASDAQRAAMMSVVGLDLASADIVAWCDAGNAGAPVRAAWQAWRARQAVDSVTARLDAAALQKTRAGMGPVTTSMRQKLAAMGQPAATCPQVTSMWNSEPFDARRKFPDAYLALAVAPAVGATTGTTTRADAPGASARAGATVYSISQLHALTQSWWGTPRSYERAKAMLQQAGPLYLRGTVVQRGTSFFIEDNDGTFTSRLAVSPRIDVSALVGQVVTVRGRLDELPLSVVFLRETQLVRDGSALVPSTLDGSTGRRRLPMPVARVSTAPGRGLAPAAIHGLLYNGYGATGGDGNYVFREEVRLLLADGWVYFRDDVAPSDLDVAASRRLEPQAWGRWRRAGTGYEIQRHDDFGNPDGDWRHQAGRIVAGWAPNERVAGGFTSAAFSGSIALGGTYSSDTYLLTKDGRWERLGYTRSSSAAMAAQGPQEFSASASSVTSGTGTQSVAGGGQPGVYAQSQQRVDDGARNRGTYRLDGLTIELRSDAGEVTRTLCVPFGADRTSIYLFGRSFSIPK